MITSQVWSPKRNTKLDFLQRLGVKTSAGCRLNCCVQLFPDDLTAGWAGFPRATGPVNGPDCVSELLEPPQRYVLSLFSVPRETPEAARHTGPFCHQLRHCVSLQLLPQTALLWDMHPQWHFPLNLHLVVCVWQNLIAQTCFTLAVVAVVGLLLLVPQDIMGN